MRYRLFLLTLVLALAAVAGARDVRLYKSAFPTRGDMRVLVVLAEYQNIGFVTPDVQGYVDRMLNEENFSDNGAAGSVRDYFTSQSGGAFGVTFDVAGPVRLSQRRSYYGADSGGVLGNDVHAVQMITEALSLLGDDVDFSLYDHDGDGIIDNVFVVYAGMDQADGAPSEAVWAHAGAVLDASGEPYMEYGGLVLRDYVCLSELRDDSTPAVAGIFCRELAHTLGLPYLGSTSMPLACTPGPWSLMDSGCFNAGGRTPAALSAYERSVLGWCEPVVLDGPASVVLRAVDAGGTPCIIPTDRPGEFFILENRRLSGWDAALPHHGMLVWHIDYDEGVWADGAVNNSSRHQYVDLVEASGTANNQSDEALRAYPYPGASAVTEFVPLPWGDGRGPIGALTGIREEGDVIYFDFDGGDTGLIAPASLSLEVSDCGVLTLTWDAVAAADDYMVDVWMADGTPLYLCRDFHTGPATTFTADGMWADTEYTATVRAVADGVVSQPTAPVTVRTGAIGMEYRRPLPPEASGLALSWLPVPDAAKYLLTIEIPAEREPVTVRADFGTPKAFALPEGWSWNGDIFGTDSPAYTGASAPALKFSSSSHTLVTDFYAEPLTALSFWLRSASAAGESTLSVEGRYAEGADWVRLRDIVMVNEAKIGHTVHVSPEGTRQLRFTYRKDIGNAALDDVEISTTSSTYAPCPGYTRYDAGLCTDIVPDVTIDHDSYFYIEAVADDGTHSLPSARVLIEGRSGVDAPLVPDSTAPVEYFDLRGIRVDKPAGGLYIRRQGATVTKVLVNPAGK